MWAYCQWSKTKHHVYHALDAYSYRLPVDDVLYNEDLHTLVTFEIL